MGLDIKKVFIRYSEAEQNLIEHLDPIDAVVMMNNMRPQQLYDRLAVQAFMENEEVPAHAALRRVIAALEKMEPRNTDEFNALCRFESE